MSNGIELSGFNDLLDFTRDLEISEQKQKKALEAGGEILLKAAQENAPNITGKTEKSIKKTITKYNGDIACKIEVKHWSKWFTEYGSSKNKSYIGWFSNSIEDAFPEAIEAIKEVILK